MPSQMFAIIAAAIISALGVALLGISIFSLMFAMFPPLLIAAVAIALRLMKKRKKRDQNPSTTDSAF